MIISDKAREILFPYLPKSSWDENRPIFDRLPIFYRQEPATEGTGLVFIENNQRRTGENSLEVTAPPIDDGTKLYINSGVTSWEEGPIKSADFLVDMVALDIDDGQWMFGLLRATSTETGLAAVAPAIYPLSSGGWVGERFCKLATFETRFFQIRNLRDIRITTDLLNTPIANWLTQQPDELLEKYHYSPKEFADEYLNPLTSWKNEQVGETTTLTITITNTEVANGSGVSSQISGIYKPGNSTVMEVSDVEKTGHTEDIPYTLDQLNNFLTVSGEFLADESFVWSWEFSGGDFSYLPVGETLTLTYKVRILQSNDEFWTEDREDFHLDYVAEQLGWSGDKAWRGFAMLPEEKRRVLLGTFGVHSKDKDYEDWPSPFNESEIPEFSVQLNFQKYADGSLGILNGDVEMESFHEFPLIAGVTYDFNKKPIFEGSFEGDFVYKEGDNGRWFVTPTEDTRRDDYTLTYEGFSDEVSTVQNPIAAFNRGWVITKIVQWKDNLNWQTYKDLFRGTWNQKGGFLPFNFVADALRLHGHSPCTTSTPYAQTSFAFPHCSTSIPEARVGGSFSPGVNQGTVLELDTPTPIDGWVFLWHRVENIAEGWDYYRLTARRDASCSEIEARRFSPLPPLTTKMLDELGYPRGVENINYVLKDEYDELTLLDGNEGRDNLTEGFFFKSDHLVSYRPEALHGPFPNVQFDFEHVDIDNGLFGEATGCELDEGEYGVLRCPELFFEEGTFNPRVGSVVWGRYFARYPFNYSDWSESFWGSLHFRFLSSMENYLTPLRVWRSNDLHCSDDRVYNYNNPLVADSNLGAGTRERHLYFLRLPAEYKRDSLDWRRAEMIANLLGYFGEPSQPTEYANVNHDIYVPKLMDEEVDFNENTVGLIYQEDYIESSIISEPEGGSFEMGAVDRVTQSTEFTPAATNSYSPRDIRKWDGSYWQRANSTELTGNVPKDERDGRLVKIFDGLPVEDFGDSEVECPGDTPFNLNTKRVWDQHPDIQITRKRTDEKQRNCDYRVCFAQFTADMSAADEPVFNPSFITDELNYIK